LNFVLLMSDLSVRDVFWTGFSIFCGETCLSDFYYLKVSDETISAISRIDITYLVYGLGLPERGEVAFARSMLGLLFRFEFKRFRFSFETLSSMSFPKSLSSSDTTGLIFHKSLNLRLDFFRLVRLYL